MKMLMAVLVLLSLCSTTANAQQVHVSFGVPTTAGPNPLVDGWWVPVKITTVALTDFEAFGSAPTPTAPHRNIRFSGNIKPVLYCYDPPWLPGETILCGATVPDDVPPAEPDGLLLDGNYWPVDGPAPRTAGAIGPESYDDPDTSFMELSFQRNGTLDCNYDPFNGVALTFRVVKRYNTSATGLITLAPPGTGTFKSIAYNCAVEPVTLTVGPPLTMPPTGGGGGGGGGHEDGAMPRSVTTREGWYDVAGRKLGGKPSARGVYFAVDKGGNRTVYIVR